MSKACRPCTGADCKICNYMVDLEKKIEKLEKVIMDLNPLVPSTVYKAIAVVQKGARG